MRVIAPLHELPDVGHPRGLEQLTQLRELLLAAVRDDRNQESALASAAARPLSIQSRPRPLRLRLVVLH